MQPGQNSAAVNTAMDRILNEYAQLKKLTPLSLLSLFNSPEFQFDGFCTDFSPHPNLKELKEKTLNFGEQYGILLPNAEYYVTCAMFLFPKTTLEKIVRLSRNYAVDFYLNDTMGREATPTGDEKKVLYEIRDRLAALGTDLHPNGDISLAEKANIEVLAEISATSPAGWFDRFLRSYLHHIDLAHKAYDCASLGYIPMIEEYIETRCHISGMPHSVLLIEYSNDLYLDWDLLQQAGVAEDLQRLNWTVSLVGALTNDLFSFEKEVIDNRSDSNLVVIILLNNFRMKLEEAITVAGFIVRDLLIDYIRLSGKITGSMDASGLLPAGAKEGLQIYLSGLKAVLQACWMWQTYTKRYKREGSIWQESHIRGEAVVS
jgi:hypothetical protein